MIILIIVFNLAAMTFVVFEVWSQFTTQFMCAPVNFLANLCFHFFYVLFDVFILFKSYAVTRFSKAFGYAALLAVLYRIGWGISDLYCSQGQWLLPLAEHATGTCNFNQNGFTGFNSTVGDLVCDFLATIAAVGMVIKTGSYKLSFQELSVHLAKENGERFCMFRVLGF
ncbi:hypothetical protein BC830DRAFT_97498 [Chytriomyces sp. MP71]|nr:hypothetical protein BC830DRAFT_97498 [Chytriomyces sp. MP71]